MGAPVRLLFGDTETFSEVDLKKHGTFRYAEDPTTEVMVLQWALDDGDVIVEDLTGRKAPSAEFMALAADPDVLLVFHNVAFDRAILRHCWGLDIPIQRWRDTMVKAYSHGLPGALGKVGEVMGLPAEEQKDKRGRELIALFCKPRPKNMALRRATRETHPVEWAEFLQYSHMDIVSMRAVDRKMPNWNLDLATEVGRRESTLWHLDQTVNTRGFAVDMDLVRAAIKAVDIEKARLKRGTIDATAGLVSSPSKRDDLLKFILAEYGVELPDMKADTLRRRLEDPELPDGVKLLISIRLEATKTSTAKYKTLLNATSADGRMRNTMQFAGATRTARWAHRLTQPGNMPRPSPGFDGELQELVVEALKGGYAAEVVSWM